MKDTQLYGQILGIRKPWKVMNVQVSLADDEVQVTVGRDGGKLTCPKCGKGCAGIDQRTRRWRHLDTCQLKTLLVADVPRVQCSEHGVVTVSVPWAEPGSGFTVLFEALVINWLKAASTSAVSDRLRLSWNTVDGTRASKQCRPEPEDSETNGGSGMLFTSIWVAYSVTRLALKPELPTMIAEDPLFYPPPFRRQVFLTV